jgi:hypothetical protein
MNALIELDLSRNRLTSLESEKFHGLFNLNYLNFMMLIKSLNRLFNDFISLVELDLNKNPILSIQDDSFLTLRNMRYLDLNSLCRLENRNSIINSTFSGLVSIKDLIVCERILQNLSDLHSLRANLEPIYYGSILGVDYYGSINVIYSKEVYSEWDCSLILKSIRFNIHLNLKEQFQIDKFLKYCK